MFSLGFKTDDGIKNTGNITSISNNLKKIVIKYLEKNKMRIANKFDKVTYLIK